MSRCFSHSLRVVVCAGLFTLFAVDVPAASAVVVDTTLRVGSAAGQPGDTGVIVPVTTSASILVGSTDVVLTFDPSVLEATTASSAGLSGFTFFLDNVAGEVRTASANGAGDFLGAGAELLAVTFTIRPGAPLGPSVVGIRDGGGPPNDLGGVPPPIPPPAVLYGVDPGRVLVGLGDITCDGAVTPEDAGALLCRFVGRCSDGDFPGACADAAVRVARGDWDCDGALTPVDASITLAVVVGKILPEDTPLFYGCPALPPATPTPTSTPLPPTPTPTPFVTATPAIGGCCVPHGTGSCDVGGCAGCVCNLDPYCCDVQWDSICVSEAAGSCAASCPCVPTATPTDTPTPTWTQTSTATPTATGPTPTMTPTGAPTLTPTPVATVRCHTFTIGAGSSGTMQAWLFPIHLDVTGHFDLCWTAEDANGERTIVVPFDTAFYDPVPVAGIGTACLSLGGNGLGVIDCNGGRQGIDMLLEMDHNTTPGSAGNSGPSQGLPDDPDCTATTILPDGSESAACRERDPCGSPTDPHEGVCNSPTHIVKSGTFGAGDMAITMVQTITILNGGPDFGSDGLPCTDDDAPEDPASPITILLSTGTSTVRLFDANNQSGVKIAPEVNCGASPCAVQVSGHAISCADLTAGNLTGLKLAGGFPALHGAVGDLATMLVQVAQ